MALDIQIGDEHLDIPPGAALEMDMNNPFLQFDDQILGEFSLPGEMLATGKNDRLTNYVAIMEKKVTNTPIDAVAIDNGIPSLRGKVKIEKVNLNLNRTSEGRISYYFLSGASSFYQDVKDKKLRAADVGGLRSFEWDDYAFTGPGFWGHVRDVMYASPGYGVSGYDYSFFPIKNLGWEGRLEGADLMNKVEYGDPNPDEFFLPAYLGSPIGGGDVNRIVPFPYLKYVMIQAAKLAGWNIAGDILDDLTFKKIVMINFRAIDWGYIKKVGSSFVNIPRDPVEFNLQDHLPDITISSFFLALRKRFGWRYDFDKATKTLFIHELNEIASTVPKDYTTKSSPIVPKQINQDTKIYALRNTFSTELGSGSPNWEVVEDKGSVDELTDLPAGTEAQYGFVYLVIAENNYYICQQNEDTEAWEWVLWAYNIYDYEPANFTEEITTEATTVGVEKYNDYLDLIPRIDQQGMWYGRTDEEIDTGIILCFNHGVRQNKAGEDYPYGSAHVYSSDFIQIADWSLSFVCKLASGAEDVGLYERNWRKLLDLLKSQEEADVKLYLPRHEYIKLSFADILVIRNTKWFIKNMKPVIPYNGEVNLRLVRI